ncbi:NUDIX hydrolase [Gloeocapsa sp. PCC 73106]|uniref:NUDIX hydrolase n=1 Tax=Gloeocapsa sp. PCC 73106 TaxID=102232 RepID=UPI0002AC294D|nr:NUDIX hydrolase [Gloeocapsa sp. PCC 73106]ELR99319.1 ADP-ribose pyrophosphatase [Gloeocapsa sp. PCC 73106]
MNAQPVTVAMAILYQQGKFLLQLRDDYPFILYPGHWGLFGGHLEPGESPEAGLQRELLEEITHQPTQLSLFRSYEDIHRIAYIYHAPLIVSLDQLVQREGQDLALVTPEAINQGYCYSEKIAQIRPLGSPHQKILQDFIKCNY